MPKINPSLNNFLSAREKKKNQIIWTVLKSDLNTPVSVFKKLAHSKKNNFLLESVHDGSYRGRYSVIGLEPDLIWKCEKGVAFVKIGNKDFIRQKKEPLRSLKEVVTASKVFIPNELPPMSSGLVGYLTYETIELYESLPKRKKSEIKLPDGFFIRPTIMTIFDNLKDELVIVATSRIDNNINPTTEYKKKVKLINKIINEIKGPIPKLRKRLIKKNYINPKSNIKKNTFLSMVNKAKQYIFSGEIFQVVISQRFKTKFLLPPFDLYRSLRSLNPSPFLFYLNFHINKKDEFSLVGSSPEILVKLEKDTITIRPIAGTRPRGSNNKQDLIYKKELLEDPKELAEHLMLLDLGRNDVGRVSKPKSVEVTEKMKVEYYSHVMHIVSNVQGKAINKKDISNILMSGFPAGTVSGAPKIRAMEIINELEPESRGVYAGCVGYFSGNGDMETCIVLRTALIKNKIMYVQAGAGIVADSNPQKEYEETINKAKALFKAAETAHEYE